MDVVIENLTNIKKLNYNIKENKINFLLGFSGAGKSSIIKALTNKFDQALDKNIYTNGEIKISNTSQDVQFEAFDENDINHFIFELEEDESFNILIQDKNDYDKLEKELENSIAFLEKELGKAEDKINKLININEGFGRPCTSKGKLKKAYSELDILYKDPNNKRIIKNINEVGYSKFYWLREGYSEFYNNENHKCPFCNKRITSKRRIKKLNEFTEIPIDSLNKLLTNIKKTDEKSNIIPPLEKIINEITLNEKTIEAYNSIKGLVINLKRDFSLENYKHIDYSSIMNKDFKSLFLAYQKLNKNIDKYKEKIKNINTRIKRIISNNKDEINRAIKSFGVPYEIILDNSSMFKYHLNLIEDKDKTLNRGKSLSSGEKNIVSLVLFIYEMLCQIKSNPDKKIVFLFDDPVLYFDEVRQTRFLKLVSYLFDKQTVLIITHSQDFIKSALGILNKQLGNVYYIYNEISNVDLYPVNKDDIGNFFTFLINEQDFMSLPFFIRCIYLRMLLESRSSDEKGYKYISKILHFSENSILKINKFYDDSEIALNTTNTYLKNEFDKYSLSINTIPSLARTSFTSNDKYKNLITKCPNDFLTINVSNLKLFDKALLLREIYSNCRKNSKIRSSFDSLSGIIHLSSQSIICINPFKFTFFTKDVLDDINSFFKGKTIINLNDEVKNLNIKK